MFHIVSFMDSFEFQISGSTRRKNRDLRALLGRLTGHALQGQRENQSEDRVQPTRRLLQPFGLVSRKEASMFELSRCEGTRMDHGVAHPIHQSSRGTDR